MKNRSIFCILALIIALSLSACGGGGAGSTSAPTGESPGVPFSVQLIPSHFTAQTNSSIILRAKVLDGNGVPMANVPVTFTNLSEPFGVIQSVLKSIGLSKPKTALSAKVVNTDSNGIATVTIRSTSSGFVTIQAEVNNGAGIVRDKKLLFFSDTFNLPIFVIAPQLFLDVDTNASFTSPDEASDFILFKNTGDNQRYIRATVVFDTSISGKIITFGSDSTEVKFENGANEIVKTADTNGQATVLATVSPSALSQTSRTINITAAAADGASNVLTLFLEPVVVNGSASSLSANPTTVSVGKTSTITATVSTNTGNAPDGTAVNFTSTCGTVDAFAQTTDGVAKAIFTAPATIPLGGVCTVSGKAGGVNIGSANITIVAGLAVQLNPATISGVSGGTVTGTISGGISPYSVSSNNPTLPAPSLAGATFTQTIPAGTSARTVLYTVTDSASSTVATTLTITGPTSLQIFPPSIPVVSLGVKQTFPFAVSAGAPPYVMTSSDPTKVFNDDGSGGGTADDGIRNGTEGGIWTSLIGPASFTVTIPANVSGGTVTLNVFDSLGATTSATITITSPGGGSLLILPKTASIVSSTSTQTFTFNISGGTPPYQTISTDPSKAFNTTAGNGLWNPANTGTATGTPLTVTFPANVTAGTVTLNVYDSVGGTTSAAITILSSGASSLLTITPSQVSVTGVSTTADNVTFNISGGVTPYQGTAFSDNTAIVPNAAVSGSTFTVTPNPVAATSNVKMTVLDNVGTPATATVVVMPVSSSLALNPSTIAVTSGTDIAFSIIGGLSPFDVYSSNTGLLTINSSGSPLMDTSSTSFTGNAIAAGSATVTVVDNDGKTVTATVTITGGGGGGGGGGGLFLTPAAPQTVTGIANPLPFCSDASLADNLTYTINGGTAPYFTVSNNLTVIPACAITIAGPPWVMTVDPQSVGASATVSIIVYDSSTPVNTTTVQITVNP